MIFLIRFLFRIPVLFGLIGLALISTGVYLLATRLRNPTPITCASLLNRPISSGRYELRDCMVDPSRNRIYQTTISGKYGSHDEYSLIVALVPASPELEAQREVIDHYFDFTPDAISQAQELASGQAQEANEERANAKGRPISVEEARAGKEQARLAQERRAVAHEAQVAGFSLSRIQHAFELLEQAPAAALIDFRDDSQNLRTDISEADFQANVISFYTKPHIFEVESNETKRGQLIAGIENLPPQILLLREEKDRWIALVGGSVLLVFGFAALLVDAIRIHAWWEARARRNA